MRQMLRSLALGAMLAVPASAQTQAGSPVTDYLTRGKNALNDLRYRDADSLAKSVLTLGTLLNKQQQIEAMQLSAAAMYPEEKEAQKRDSAIVMIKRLVDVGVKTMPRDISHPELDSLFLLVVRATQPGKIVVGSRAPGAVVYVNDQPQGVVASLRTVELPPNKEVKLSIRAEGCTPWDTIVTVQAMDSVRIGIRTPRCSR